VAAPRFVELRAATGAHGVLASLLLRFGFQVARSRGEGGGGFGATRLLRAFLRPLLAAIADGESSETVDATLRDLGFVRRCEALLAARDPGRLAGRLGLGPEEALVRLAATGGFRGGTVRPLIADALAVSMLDGVLDEVEKGGLSHPFIVDLAARELLDYPLRHLSLCRHLGRARIRAALERQSDLTRWLGEPVVERAAAYAASGKDLYR
jgi:hypothetical protein